MDIHNYIIKTPNILNNETNVTLDYYGDDLKLSFNDINDELTGTIQRKINKSKRNINRVYSEKIKYLSDENSITFDNYTDSGVRPAIRIS